MILMLPTLRLGTKSLAFNFFFKLDALSEAVLDAALHDRANAMLNSEDFMLR